MGSILGKLARLTLMGAVLVVALAMNAELALAATIAPAVPLWALGVVFIIVLILWGGRHA